ncbi:pimeloyl-ACP methyl ester esterase BioH [Vibrio astriarenae]|uniref:Pimeloyl-[acyl-carrier protein] methyl ester esterase n=1 Tax=Vibrio astriarenae TaxID=1481923 RepID=A0A7Z2YEU3_9VIBR|nr:pimeloyl-ACP methyl ester esterase BioH [Vibrio astriarenae]QIA64489.1 pimeloyl-ACP methyl ester esterase BioH [Vibrio astriarenae]
MSTRLHWQTQGQGPDVILLHGWGMNGAVWEATAQQLAQHFTVHVVDLPGYGHSADVEATDMHSIVSLLIEQAPKQATWIGWSLGGLVASQVALSHPERVQKLVTVASSPKFAADLPWRGIKPQVLSAFTEQLTQDFDTTIERFMALQAMGSPSARQDVKTIKQAVLSRPSPNENALQLGLSFLANIDLREAVSELTLPVLRLYGRLDGLVPVKVAADMQSLLPSSSQFIFTQSAHAPFITESEEFNKQLVTFIG